MRLSIEDRDPILAQLTPEQRLFLNEQMIRGRRTAFANALAAQKGHHIPDDASPEDIEALLTEWVYTGYYDTGQVSPELRCECGRPLRYQHHVEHKSSGEVKKFGIEHLKEHLGIDAAAVAAIKKGFDAIDFELDDILTKVVNGWQPDPELLQIDDIPKDIQLQLEQGLPLLDRQIQRLRQKRNANRAAGIPLYFEKRPQPEEIPNDLFHWVEIQEKPTSNSPLPDHFLLPNRLKDPVLKYLANGVRSAMVICELLMKDHGAPDTRFITGKPHLFVPVCKFIESQDGIRIAIQGTDDRLYSY
ncbi:hypothetical protein [Cohnella nanjingensis]|uniref:DUF3895 domain-containing protein n=1 Tax=Cohnella nanjingensis TaxID=1387779 RepID=A0A7X0VF13_9BACL|nr:hypothetical protein [Cohnella nanjingensis]MBB6670149.1 hypothetical protein [Cohnella nanjingensis]